MRLHPTKTSICPGLAIFRVILAIALNCLLNCLLHPLAVVAVNAFSKCLDGSCEGSGWLPVDSFHVFRPVDASAFDVPIPGTDIRGVQGETHSLFAVSQRLFDLPYASNVASYFRCAHDLARRILDWRNGQRYKNSPARFCDSHGFEMLDSFP